MTSPCEDALPYKEATIAFLTATYLFEMYLQYRQHRLFSVTQIPTELQGVVSQDVYDKARRYSRDKSWYVFANMTFSQIETVVCTWTCGDAFFNHALEEAVVNIPPMGVFFLLFFTANPDV